MDDLNKVVKRLHMCLDTIKNAREFYMLDTGTQRDLQLACDQIQNAIMWTNHAIHQGE